MIALQDLIPLVAILTLCLGMPSLVFYWIIRLKRENRLSSDGNAMGMGELEERIQLAVERANEPLRHQSASLEQRMIRMDESRSLSEREESPLLAAHDERTV